jgi:hypothetical protein
MRTMTEIRPIHHIVSKSDHFRNWTEQQLQKALFAFKVSTKTKTKTTKTVQLNGRFFVVFVFVETLSKEWMTTKYFAPCVLKFVLVGFGTKLQKGNKRKQQSQNKMSKVIVILFFFTPKN